MNLRFYLIHEILEVGGVARAMITNLSLQLLVMSFLYALISLFVKVAVFQCGCAVQPFLGSYHPTNLILPGFIILYDPRF